jgi:hypothetical protein
LAACRKTLSVLVEGVCLHKDQVLHMPRHGLNQAMLFLLNMLAEG